MLASFPVNGLAGAPTAKQQSLDEWRALTSPSAFPPRVFVKGNDIRFFFPTPSGVEAFNANWSRVRVPIDGYRVNSALLHWNQKLAKVPDHQHAWREATVIAGAEWRRLATNLIAALTPQAPMHAAYYQAFLADGVLYRDAQGNPQFAPLGEQPKNVLIEHRHSVEETLDRIAQGMEAHLAQSHPGQSLFLLMAPNAKRFTQPLLLDRKQRHCVFLSPAALYDTTDAGLGLSGAAQGLSALVLEGHGWALLKNPLSSALRLGDLGVQSLVRFVRFPLPKPGDQVPPLSRTPGMDLAQWESWLDRYTGTRRQDGSLEMLIDGDRFFSRLRQAITEATNHIHFNVYIFDRDDVAVRVADQLKQRSRDLEVKVILDRLGSLGAGASPPATPFPEDFVPPASIAAYLAKGSRVQVRPFLNPWFSSDHSKIYLIDGARGWVGGMNLGREYRYEWHDLMVELRGPVVASLETDFNRDWAYAGPFGDLAYTAELLGGPRKPPSNCSSNQWMKVRLLPTRTAWKPFAAAVRGSLARAKRYVYVQNPYLFDKRVIIALVKARERGVDVRVVLPRANDMKAGARANLVIANYLLEHGVRVYFYPGMTHVKALLVDDWACLGSGNLNHLSLRFCQEQNVATSDPAFTAAVKHSLFEEDFARSYELSEPVSVDWMDFLTDLLLEGF
ncbi:MAG TPA: phosphatidylserine/phosphatidylglycerophosphate/cardiolipin synthase family protein [Bacillota bacterium]|nr:phosphatidylserine/phosphatidylglycerophosphate/cardiolipin synthase family protein [Bacillota bacterium]